MGMDELLRCYREKQRQLEKNGLRQQISFYLQTRRTDDSLLNRRLLDECYLKLVPGIDRHIAVIGVLAMVSPLLGLLGTGNRHDDDLRCYFAVRHRQLPSAGRWYFGGIDHHPERVAGVHPRSFCRGCPGPACQAPCMSVWKNRS